MWYAVNQRLIDDMFIFNLKVLRKWGRCYSMKTLTDKFVRYFVDKINWSFFTDDYTIDKSPCQDLDLSPITHWILTQTIRKTSETSIKNFNTIRKGKFGSRCKCRFFISQYMNGYMEECKGGGHAVSVVMEAIC